MINDETNIDVNELIEKDSADITGTQIIDVLDGVD